MRLDLTKRESLLLIDCLKQPVGVAKVDRPEAYTLLRKLQAQFTPTASRPTMQQHRAPIRSAWPSGDVKTTHKPDSFYSKKEELTTRVANQVDLNHSKAQEKKHQLTVSDVLEGLVEPFGL